MGSPENTSTAAPTIQGHPLQTLAIARSALPAYPLLPQLAALIIESYDAVHYQPIIPPEANRLPGGSQQLLHEIEPGGWTLILADAQDGATTLYGTVTLEPKVQTPVTANDNCVEDILRDNEDVDAHVHPVEFSTSDNFPPAVGEARWNVRMLCVNVRFQKRGLAEWLMHQAQQFILEQELKANVRRLIGPSTTSVRLLLTVVDELSGSWYTKRGWAAYHVKRMPPGFIGSEGGFTLVDMFKFLEVPLAAGPQATAL